MGGSGICSITALTSLSLPAGAVINNCRVAGSGIALPKVPSKGVISEETSVTSFLPTESCTVTSSYLPRLPSSSMLTWGMRPSGMPFWTLTTISI